MKGESPESSNLTFKTKMKHFTPVKGNVVGLQTKKRKLLVGGIFQAKRHQLTVKPETTSKNESHDNFGQTQASFFLKKKIKIFTIAII